MTFFCHRKGLEIGSKLPNTSELYGFVYPGMLFVCIAKNNDMAVEAIKA